MRSRRDLPAPGYETLREAFEEAWRPRNFADEHAARHYAERAEPALKRFYEREVANLAQSVGFEVGFTLADPGRTRTSRRSCSTA